MQIVGVIPARYGSTRFPGKPLAQIGSKSLIQWVLEGASQSKKISKVVVATDDERILNHVNELGFEAYMTDSELPTGSDRVWQTVKEMDADVVVNIQGDEPLISGEVLDVLLAPFESDSDLDMATLGREMDDEALASENTAKIVLNQFDEALYFSRFPIPYSRNKSEVLSGCLKHIGIYAYSKPFLEKFCRQPQTDLEKSESLEQLRALYLGARIKVLKVSHDSWGVDTPDDVETVRKKLEDKYGQI